MTPDLPPAADPFVIAHLGTAVGLRGEVRCHPDGLSLPQAHELLQRLRRVWVAGEDLACRREVQIRSLRQQGRCLVIAFEGIADRTSLQNLPAHPRVVVDERHARGILGESEFLAADLIGCRVETPDGEPVGRIVDVTNGPQDLLHIEPDPAWLRSRQVPPTEKAFLLPLTAELVPDIDLGRRCVIADPPPGIELV